MTETAIEIQRTDLSALSAITREEVDIAISTAKRYPRDLARFESLSTRLVTTSDEFAGKCLYAIPRGGKIIVGPSVRFAEVIGHTWGNIRSGGRVIEEQDKYVVAQGICFDLEQNVTVSFEVKRKIVDREGQRFNADMIANTGNAACAIALRNSILRVIPKSFWGPIFDKVIETVGDPRQLPVWRSLAIDWFAKHHKLEPHQVCKIVQVQSPDDIGVDQIIQLRGIRTALEDGDITIEEVIRHSKRMPAAPRRASESLPETAKRSSDAAPQDASTTSAAPAGAPKKGRKGKKGEPPIDKAAAETVAAAAADGEKKKSQGVQTEIKGKKITEKERQNLFRIVAHRDFGYDDVRKIIKDVIAKHGFTKAEDVTVAEYETICAELRAAKL